MIYHVSSQATGFENFKELSEIKYKTKGFKDTGAKNLHDIFQKSETSVKSKRASFVISICTFNYSFHF